MSTAPLPAKHSIQWYHEYLLFKKSWGAHCAAESERGDFLWTSRPDRMIWSRLSFAVFVCSVPDIYPFGLPPQHRASRHAMVLHAQGAFRPIPLQRPDPWIHGTLWQQAVLQPVQLHLSDIVSQERPLSEMVAVTGGQSDLKVTSHRRYGWETYWQDRLPALDVPSHLDVSHLASSGVKTFGQQLRSLKLYPWENVLNKYFAWHVPCCLRAFASSESSR